MRQRRSISRYLIFSFLVFLSLVLIQQGCRMWDEPAPTPTPTVTRQSAVPENEVAEAAQAPPVRNSIGYKLARISAGRFLMGSPAGELGRNNDEVQHRVTISRDFLIGTTAVTQEKWRRVMGDNPSSFSTCGDNCPVENISWYEAVKFCNRLSDMEGLLRCYEGEGEDVEWNQNCDGYRLPTEAEWEYAARAGSATALATGPVTAAGNEECLPDRKLDLIAWYCANSGGQAHAVAQKRANAWGLFDTYGNVAEWVWDRYGKYSSRSLTDPQGASGGSLRVFRGGSWTSFAQECRAAARGGRSPIERALTVGFRLARSFPRE